MTDLAEPWSGWHETVMAVRSDPHQVDIATAHYLDAPLRQAARRFAHSLEYAHIRRIVGMGPGALLDLNAGHGITSCAFGESRWSVTAVEPDPSDEVGAGAIRKLAAETGFKIEALVAQPNALPVPDASMKVVFGREALQRADDLDAVLAEAYRVLKPGGKALFVREPVVDDESDPAVIEAYRRSRHFGHAAGGHPHTRERYESALAAAGFKIKRVWGPLEWNVNYYPAPEIRRRGIVLREMIIRPYAWLLGPHFFRHSLERTARRSIREPAQRYAFYAVKPAA